MSTRLCFSVVLLSLLFAAAPSRVRSLSGDAGQAQTSKDPQITLKVTDWWAAPVEIRSVKVGEQAVATSASIAATDDWTKYVSIDAISKSDKAISYISYAIDFTIAGEDKLYRLRVQDGTFNAAPESLVTSGLRLAKGQKHQMRFTDNAWNCSSTVVNKINERKAKILKAELFVEMVGFTDDTLWAFGSRLKRNKATSAFENIDAREMTQVRNHAGKETAAPNQSGCCAPTMDYSSGSAQPVQIIVTCSSCPPFAGGGTCPSSPPSQTVNSLSGPGGSGAGTIVFTHC